MNFLQNIKNKIKEYKNKTSHGEVLYVGTFTENDVKYIMSVHKEEKGAEPHFHITSEDNVEDYSIKLFSPEYYYHTDYIRRMDFKLKSKFSLWVSFLNPKTGHKNSSWELAVLYWTTLNKIAPEYISEFEEGQPDYKLLK